MAGHPAVRSRRDLRFDGAIALTIMAVMVKFLGKDISPLEIQFFRSIIGLMLVVPLFCVSHWLLSVRPN